MKTFILICLGLIALAHCQEVVLESGNFAYQTGDKFYKEFERPEWDNYLDFAVWGWFKIESKYSRDDWSTIFHFTSNNESRFGNNQNVGDRVLCLFVKWGDLYSPTYTTNNNDYSDPMLHFTNEDLDKWGFFYIAHGSQQSTRLFYVELGHSAPQTSLLQNVVHKPSTYYRMNVGQSSVSKFFQGPLFRITIQGGNGAYRESNFSQLQNVKPDTTLPDCPVLYTGCAQTGTAINVCQNIPSFDVKSVKSVYVPKGRYVTLHQQDNYIGKKVTYNQSIDCITELNWQFLIESGAVTVTTTKNHLKRNSH